jgi:hypothetical protein
VFECLSENVGESFSAYVVACFGIIIKRSRTLCNGTTVLLCVCERTCSTSTMKVGPVSFEFYFGNSMRELRWFTM